MTHPHDIAAEGFTYLVAAAGFTAPWWLAYLREISEVAGLLTSVLALTLVALQIALRWREWRRGRQP